MLSGVQIITSKQIELHRHLGGHERIAEASNFMRSKNVEGIVPAAHYFAVFMCHMQYLLSRG